MYLRFLVISFIIAHNFFAFTASAVSPSDAAKVPAENVALGLIVKFDKAASARSATMNSPQSRAATLSAHAARIAGQSVRLSFNRELATEAELWQFDAPRPLAEAEALARSIAALPGVLYAAPNRKMFTQAVPRDAEYSAQWGFRLNATEQGANFEAAWDVTRGNPNQTIGLVDSGIAKAHPELASQFRTHTLFPNGGYDFMKSAAAAGDGDARDNDPEQAPNGCGHGSHTAGTIAAQTAFGGGVGRGVAGGAPLSKVLMARSLDFSGEEADVIDGMLWLAGAPVPDVATNPNPVRLINMSLGGAGACGAAYADAVANLAARGTLVIAAAGNSNTDVSSFAPANCAGVVAVAANTVNGNRASFSNYGRGVTITAPGDSIYSTGGSEGENCYKSGTSMAAPHVSAALALAQTVNPSLSVNQSILSVKASARGFPTGSSCNNSDCGAGLLDARSLLDFVAPNAPVSVGWTSTSLSVRENDGSVTLPLTRIGAAGTALSVNVTNIEGTAASGVDFGAPVPSVVSWNAGDTSDRAVTIPILYRSGEQGARQFRVALTNATAGASIVAPSEANVRITEVDCNQVTPLNIGDTVVGTLGQTGTTYCHGGVRGPEYDTVRYRFTANAGDIVSIGLASTTPAANGVLDPYVYLLDANLKVVAENDDIVNGSVRNSLIDGLEIPANGTYYVDATTWSPTTDKTGSYELRLKTCGVYAAGVTCNLDANGDARFDANDATMALRRMLGFSGGAMTVGIAHRSCASRTDASAIETFLDTQIKPASQNELAAYDLDGNGAVDIATDGLMLLRVALKLSGNSVVTKAIGANATRSTWAAIRTYLNASCGLSLAQ
jgi:serine protease